MPFNSHTTFYQDHTGLFTETKHILTAAQPKAGTRPEGGSHSVTAPKRESARMLSRCQLPHPQEAQTKLMLKEFYKHAKELWGGKKSSARTPRAIRQSTPGQMNKHRVMNDLPSVP